MLNKKAASVKFEKAVAYLLKNDTKNGYAVKREAEKIYPGIKDYKIKEYMENGTKDIENRRYLDAQKWYENILAIDPSNAKAAEMLGKIRDLKDMAR
jgi:hypothetical protein